jgi:hypothetical protein
MDVAGLYVALTISNQSMSGSFIVSSRRECVLDGVLIVHVPSRSTKTMTQGCSVRFCYFLHRLSMFNILYKTRPCYGIPDSVSLLFLSVPDEVNVHATRTVLFSVSLND